MHILGRISISGKSAGPMMGLSIRMRKDFRQDRKEWVTMMYRWPKTALFAGKDRFLPEKAHYAGKDVFCRNMTGYKGEVSLTYPRGKGKGTPWYPWIIPKEDLAEL